MNKLASIIVCLIGMLAAAPVRAADVDVSVAGSLAIGWIIRAGGA